MANGERAEMIRQAIALIAAHTEIRTCEPPPGSHVSLHISGLDEPACADAFGIYLCALIAGAVHADLQIREALLGTGAEFGEELREVVETTIGADNELTQYERDHKRNPWIAECLGHLLMMVTPTGEVGVCLPAVLHSATLPHDKVTQQGLDLVVLYSAEDGVPGICIGESKASSDDAQGQLNRSIALFRAVDKGDRDYQLRNVVLSALLGAAPDHVRERIHHGFWRNERTYLPVIAFGSGGGFNPDSSRPDTFGSLLPPHAARRLVTLELADFHGFFDRVADAIRSSVSRFV